MSDPKWTLSDCLRHHAKDCTYFAPHKLIEAADALDGLESLRAELAAVTAANHAVAVCAKHTSEIINHEGCVICDLAVKDAVIEAALALKDFEDRHQDDRVYRWMRDEAIRLIEALVRSVRALDAPPSDVDNSGPSILDSPIRACTLGGERLDEEVGP